MSIKEFRLPDPGEGLVEADIVTWRVAVGDQVKINDILLEVETSKSLVELPSPYAGTVTALLVAEGDTVDVGKPVISIEDGTTVPTAPTAPVDADEGAEAKPGGRVPVLVGYGPRTGETKRRPRKGGARPESADVAHDQAAHTFDVDVPVSRRADARTPLRAAADTGPVGAPLPAPGVAETEPGPGGSGVLAKPPVRKLAKDRGVDLASLVGSGPGGVITRDDVLTSVQSPPELVEGPSAPEQTTPGETRIPIKGVRKATAQAMVSSAFTAPHVTEWVTCDVSSTMELVDRLRKRREFADLRISPLLIITKAVTLALGRTPELNSAWDEAAQEIVIKHDINLGIAAATPRGLMVPNMKAAQRLNLLELAQALAALVATAREGRSQPAELAGGTFTITNVGVFGVDAGTPILNPGEAGILCVGQIARRPWVVGSGDDERIVPRWVTTLALAFDHRLADGEQGSRFLSDVANLLGDPALALLY